MINLLWGEIILNEQIQNWLTEIAHDLLDQRQFLVAESICNLLNAIESEQWSRLPTEEQRIWLDRLNGLLGYRDGLASDPSWEQNETLTKLIDALSHYKSALDK